VRMLPSLLIMVAAAAFVPLGLGSTVSSSTSTPEAAGSEKLVRNGKVAFTRSDSTWMPEGTVLAVANGRIFVGGDFERSARSSREAGDHRRGRVFRNVSSCGGGRCEFGASSRTVGAWAGVCLSR
jgi:hypothetical protein